MAESYTVPHNLPKQGTLDLVRSPSGDNVRKQLNALADASNTALESVKAAAASDATTKADAAEADAIADATTKYGGLPTRVTAVETKNTDQDGRLTTLESGQAAVAWDKGSTTADLNTVQTSGRYNFTVTTALNQPVAVAGNLEVFWSSTTGIQVYTTKEATPRTYSRSYLAGAWGAWGKGEAGARLTTLETDKWLKATVGNAVGQDANNYTTAGYIGILTGSIPNMPTTNLGALEVFPFGTGIIQRFTTWEVTPRVFWRRYASSVWGAWTEGSLTSRVTTLETDKWKRANLAGGTDFNTVLTPGAYPVLATAHPNQPAAVLGTLEVLPLNTWYIQRFTTSDTVPRVFQRRYASGAWYAWAQLGGTTATGSTGGKSGMKVVPLTMTAPGTPLETTTNAGAVRWVRRYAAMPKRVRVHVANANTGNALTGDAALTVASIRVGVGDAAGGYTQGVIAASSGTIAANGAEYVTPWVTVPGLTDGGYMAVTVAWSGGGGTAKLQNNQGGGWTTTDNTLAGAADVTGWTRSQTTPLHCWVEAEVPAVTPVLLANGDSITVGTATTDPVGDSWAAKYAYDHGALPIILAMHGSKMTNWTTGAVRWNQFGTFDPNTVTDTIVTTLGQNDLADAGVTLADLQTRHNTFMDALRELFPTQPVYLGHITPSSKSTDLEAIRKDFNTWRAGLPKGERGVLDFATAVGTADGEDLAPAYSADGLHPNTAGQGVMADVVKARPVTPFTVAPATLQALAALV